MFTPILAEGDSTPTWLTLLASGTGVTLFTLLLNQLNEWSKRRTERANGRDTQATSRAEIYAQVQKEVVHEDAALQAAKLQAQSATEQRYFDALQQFNRDHAAEVDRLRTELNTVRTETAADKRTLGHEIRELRGQVQVSLNVYHELFNIATLLIAQLKQNRARIKRLTEEKGEKFDEEEFMPVDISQFDPKRLFSQFGAPSGKSGAAFLPTKAKIEITEAE